MNLIANAAAHHHAVLLLIVQVAVLLFSARALGEIARRLGQPSVVGEIFAGVILGPTLLSGFFPLLATVLVPEAGSSGAHMLEVVSLFGAMFLLILTGLETDLPLIKRHARTAVSVSLGGIIVTFATGYLLAQSLPDSLVAAPDRRLVFNLFVATAMSVSAIPVVAKVLMDLNLMRRDVGQTILASGMVDDSVAWTLLSIVLGIAAAETVVPSTLLFAGTKIFVFIALAFTVGRWAIQRLLHFTQDKVASPDKVLTLVVVVAFVLGAVTQGIGIEAVLGGFVAGILFGTMPRFPPSVSHQLESVSMGIFSPIFFASAGLKVNLRDLLYDGLWVYGLLVLAVAIGGKYIGTYIGARVFAKKDHWTALAFGSGLNARGAVEIIIASIGLGAGILTQSMYSVIVLMAVFTSVMAPFGLRWSLSHVTLDDEEAARLKREEIEADSIIATARRVLVPVRVRTLGPEDDIQTIKGLESHLLQHMPGNLSATLLTVVAESEKTVAQEFLKQLSSTMGVRDVQMRVVVSSNATEAILAEAAKDYDLVLLGATRNADNSTVFNTVVDEIIRFAPCTVMVAQGRADARHWHPKRVLVPTNGAPAAQRAAQAAFAIAQSEGEETTVVVLHSVAQSAHELSYDATGASHAAHMAAGADLVDHLKDMGTTLGVKVETAVRVSPTAPDAILAEVRRSSIDLIVLGTDLRPGSERLYLGRGVEKILAEATCPVLIINHA